MSKGKRKGGSRGELVEEVEGLEKRNEKKRKEVDVTLLMGCRLTRTEQNSTIFLDQYRSADLFCSILFYLQCT